MLTRQEILARLGTMRGDLFRRYPLSALGLFGSFARGDQTEGSDIDIIAEFSEPVGFEIVDLAIELESLLESRVDLVSRAGVPRHLLPYIERQVIYV